MAKLVYNVMVFFSQKTLTVLANYPCTYTHHNCFINTLITHLYFTYECRINASSTCQRTVKDVKKKWQDLQSHTKKKETNRLKHIMCILKKRKTFRNLHYMRNYSLLIYPFIKKKSMICKKTFMHLHVNVSML